MPPDTCQDVEPLDDEPLVGATSVEAPIRIGAILSATGVTRATVHHYVAEGLLPEPVKTARNMALYSSCCIERVGLIRRLQSEQRHSLRDVRDILTRAESRADLARIRDALDAASLHAEAAPLQATSATEPLTLPRLCEHTGLSWAEVDALDRAGVLPTVRHGGTRLVDPEGIAVAVLVATVLEGAGFPDRDTALDYITRLPAAIDALVAIESAGLPRSDGAGTPGAEVLTRSTPLLVALRRRALLA